MLELGDGLNTLNKKRWWITYQRMLLPDPTMRWAKSPSGHQLNNKWEDRIRLPWTHKRDPFDFHSLNVSLSVNHEPVPSWKIPRAALWFIDGSGGESQVRMSLWS